MDKGSNIQSDNIVSQDVLTVLQCNTKCSGNVVLSYDSGCSDVAQEGSDFSGNCWCCVWTLPVIYGKVGRRAERVKTGLSFPKTTWGWSSGAVHGWEKARGACNFPIKLLTSSCIISVAKISNNCIYISHWLLSSCLSGLSGFLKFILEAIAVPLLYTT